MPVSRPRLAAIAAGLAAVLVLATACTGSPPDPQPGPTPSSPPARPLTVLSTDPIRRADPAAVTDPGSVVLSLNVFQRLMTAEPGQSVLKPDAARDCLFTSATVYTCTLNQNLRFHNGNELTSRDVRFSIQRALRLDVPGSSATLLSTLRRIETPDPLTVQFVLSRADTQFGWALASPAASIVDEQVYDADELRPNDQPVIGSGAFSVVAFGSGELRLRRYEAYVGRTPAAATDVAYRSVADSAALEHAISTGTADVIWRGPSSAAITRYTRQVAARDDDTTDEGYGMQTQTGTRVLMLEWSPVSRHRANEDLRNAIAVSLQGDRTLDSVVPGGIGNHISAFPLGGTAEPDVTWSNRIRLTLGYDPTMPDGRDIATQVRTRLEDTGGLSVRLRAVDPTDPGASPPDLMVRDRKAWTSTGLAWLQPYLDAPLPDSAADVQGLERRFRAAVEEADATRAMASLQRKAAADLVLLPMTQSDEYLFTAPGVEFPANSFGPGWQLGLWGVGRG